MTKMVLVLGGGFTGIRVVQDLARKFRAAGLNHEIVLVDKESVHVFRADLFEVATAYNRKITEKCLIQLRETIATPINKLVTGRAVFNSRQARFLQDEVLSIDEGKRLVYLKKTGELKYDYLVVALGSETNFFNILGLREHAMTMKTVQDGIRFNCYLDEFFKDLWQKGVSWTVNIVIGGGGATGVEMAAELHGSLRKLCRKYRYDCRKVNVELVEGTDKLLGMEGRGTELVLARLEKIGVNVLLQSLIQKVEKKELSLKGAGGKLRKKFYDVLVWTGGVKVNEVVAESLGEAKYGGAVLVNPFLQSYKNRNVFAGGDNAWFADPTAPGKRVPMLGSVAVEEGPVIAENLFRLINGGSLIEFKPGKIQMVVSIGGKYAIWKSGERIFEGRWVWLIRRLVYLKYALSILPFWKAVRKWVRSNRIFMEND